MTLFLRLLFGSILFFFVDYSLEAISFDQCEQTSPLHELDSFCSNYDFYESDANFDAHWIPGKRCQFSNLSTIYIKNFDESFQLDIKGISGDRMKFDGYEKNITLKNLSCDELANATRQLEQLQRQEFSEPLTRHFQSQASYRIVASEESCLYAKDLLTEWLQILVQEGRNQSDLVCVPSKIIKTKSPGQIRKFIQSKPFSGEGIILVGSDIPPYELFYEWKYEGAKESSFYYGASDLPYGSTDSFFSDGMKKTHSRLKEKAYRSKDFVYRMDLPSPYAFDLAQFRNLQIKKSRNQKYRQTQSVTRWLPSANKMEIFRSDLKRFIDRRNTFFPSSPRIVRALDGQGLLYREGNDNYQVLKRSIAPMENHLQNMESDILAEVDSSTFAHFMDRRTNFLSLSAHGTSNSIGNLNTFMMKQLDWLPPIVHLDACLVGAWFLTSDISDSIMASMNSLLMPPLVSIGSQTVTALKTFGEADDINPEVLLSGWRIGQTISERQKETLNISLAIIQSGSGPYRSLWSELYDINQLFSGLSLFGDPSIEL